MQCSWYLLEEGDAYKRAGNLPMAVKRYEQVISVRIVFKRELAHKFKKWHPVSSIPQVFQEFEDDEYDFHTYSLRKLTLNAYRQ